MLQISFQENELLKVYIEKEEASRHRKALDISQ